MSTTTPASALARIEVAFGRLRRLWESPALRRRFHERMGVAIDPADVRTLRAVAAATDECGVGDVADALGVDGSTASRLLDKAVVAGYLTRGGSRRDRRRSVLALTDTGRDLHRRSLRVREELLAELTADHGHTVTATADTPHGRHHWYRLPNGLEVPRAIRGLGDGIDLLGDHGYAIAPPSTITTPCPKPHDNGDRCTTAYTWTPVTRRLAELPSWVPEQLAHRTELRRRMCPIPPTRLRTRELRRTLAGTFVEGQYSLMDRAKAGALSDQRNAAPTRADKSHSAIASALNSHAALIVTLLTASCGCIASPPRGSCRRRRAGSSPRCPRHGSRGRCGPRHCRAPWPPRAPRWR